jgi:predicted porin
MGFSAVAGFEPNSNGLKEGYQADTAASSTSANLSSSPVPGDIGSRRKNTVDAGIQYLNTINGFKIKAAGQILHGAPISYTGPAASLTAAPYGGYDNLNVYQLGGQVTFAGLTLGANIKGGQVEDNYTFKPKGGRDALAYIIGASYVIGPYVVGASYFNSQSNGGYVPGGKVIARTLSEYGVAVGGNYVISPDLSLFTQYMYGHRHQPGNSFGVTQVPANTKGNSQGQVIAIGATLKW